MQSLPDRIAILTALVVDRSICLECLRVKSGMRAVELEKLLTTIGTALQLYRAPVRCRVCGETRDSVAVEPPVPPPRVPA